MGDQGAGTFVLQGSYDIIVVGGGHAGAEAAWVASNLGASVALVTMEHDAIGRMSCNPAIGGLGKGQMVREVDALGGIIGLAADQAGIQFRMLNRSKGPAVWAPRAQCDRDGYPKALQSLLSQARSLDIIEGSVQAIEVRESAGTCPPDPPSAEYVSSGSMWLSDASVKAGCSATPCGWRRACNDRPVAAHKERRYTLDTCPADQENMPPIAGRKGLRESQAGRCASSVGGNPPISPLAKGGQEGWPTSSGGGRADEASSMPDDIDPRGPQESVIASPRSEVPGPPRKRVTGVTLTDGRRLKANTVILATGTFLRGLMHCGMKKTEGGRLGEQPAVGLSASLEALGLTLGRLKTGTPPRVHRDTVNYDACEAQPGDDIPTPFSMMTDGITRPQINCWITWTNHRAHRHIYDNLDRAPLYTGQIRSTGPRYCPSIEDKVVRFADKNRHQIFLEPEGYDDERVYCNGIATSLPRDVQDAVVHEVAGLESARIIQYGYAIEYDWVPTHQIKSSLETKLIAGLYLAGQINGTSGYEEAAGQGLVAGVNAVRYLRDESPFVLGRDQAYIGVLIDDLITRPPTEPYRMFTSRAEYRLLLRADNADQRLTPIGRQLGIVDDQRWTRFEHKREAMAAIGAFVRQGTADGVDLATWIRRPQADVETLADALARLTDRVFCVDALSQVLLDAKYAGYVDRQARQIERFRRLESLAIPEQVDYAAMPELRLEARERFAHVAPRTLGQAARISGISPADVTVLWIYLTGRRAAHRENHDSWSSGHQP